MADEFHVRGGPACPVCGVTSVEMLSMLDLPNPPKEGDYSICTNCEYLSEIHVTEEGVSLKKPSTLKFAAAMINPDIIRLRIAIHMIVLAREEGEDQPEEGYTEDDV